MQTGSGSSRVRRLGGSGRRAQPPGQDGLPTSLLLSFHGLCTCRPGIRHPPRAERPKPAHQQHAPVPGSSCCALPAGSKQQLSGAAAAEAGRRTSNGTRASSRLWYEYYCLRMNCRWRLRLVDTQQALGTSFLAQPQQVSVRSRNHRCSCAVPRCVNLQAAGAQVPPLSQQPEPARHASRYASLLLLLQHRRARAFAWGQV